MKIVDLTEIKVLPEFRTLTPEELKEAYRLAREAFTAADLQRFTEIDPGTPIEEVLAELEAIHREVTGQSHG